MTPSGLHLIFRMLSMEFQWWFHPFFSSIFSKKTACFYCSPSMAMAQSHPCLIASPPLTWSSHFLTPIPLAGPPEAWTYTGSRGLSYSSLMCNNAKPNQAKGNQVNSYWVLFIWFYVGLYLTGQTPTLYFTDTFPSLQKCRFMSLKILYQS